MNPNLPNSLRSGPDERGHFGIFGGRFVAETLMPLILDLEQAYAAAKVLGKPLGEIQRRRPADIIAKMAAHLGVKCRIDFRLGIGLLEIEDQRHQRFGDEPAAENTEMPALVGAATKRIGKRNTHARFATF